MAATIQSVLSDALSLSPDERRELAEALCEAIVQFETDTDVPAWHLEILERRLRESSGDPSDLIPAEQVYEELRLKLRGKLT